MVVNYVSRFHKDLRSAPPYIQKKVGELAIRLEAAETLETSGVDFKRMEGQKAGENYYRIRIGDWRIGLEYVHPDIMLLRIMVRGNIYHAFPPKS